MSEEEKDKKEKKDLTFGERLVNWAKAFAIIIPLIGATAASVLGYFKSDDAQKDVDDQWKKLEERVLKHESVINKQSSAIEKLTRRIIYFQGHQEGVRSGKLYEQNVSLQRQLDELKARKVPKSVKVSEIKKLLGVARKPKSRPKAAGDSPVQKTIPRLIPKPFRKGK
jgi:hypothetical protein